MFASGKSASVSAVANYIEDVFSTYLYTGNGSTQTITNGIDLSTEGGLVWLKNRDGVPANQNHNLVDTLRGINKPIYTNSAGAQLTQNTIASFDTTGFTLGGFGPNGGGATYASWTFRKQPKFFTQGTYSGNGSTQAITHDLGSAPGCVIVKNITTSGSWIVWHRGLSSGYYIQLNGTGAQDNLNATRRFGNNSATVDPTSTTITVGDLINTSGDTWVYYAFAHDAGGFGLTGNDNVISCGSVVGAGSSGTTVTLGYEPQWILIKNASNSQDWWVVDNMRGLVATVSSSAVLRPNLSDAETTGFSVQPTSTGFTNFVMTTGQTYIYIAIRRGPMKVPTTGTSVYNAIARTGTAAVATVTGVGFAPDLVHVKDRTNAGPENVFFDRLRGVNNYLVNSATAAEVTLYSNTITSYNMDGISLGADGSGNVNSASGSPSYINHFFRRAPGFFDEVCYTGTGSATTFSHNLGVVPELLITKNRSNASNWRVYSATLGNTKYLTLNGDQAEDTLSTMWNNTTPTSSVFTVGTSNSASGQTYVAYLFASALGVSKVGSYTGNGSNQTINCGFTGGARFVMIKRTDSTGDWYVWDTARGIVSGNDPRLSLNTTAAEVTTDDSVDTDSTGFVVNQLSATNINVTSATYIFLSIS